ncbi:MAG: cob(I)yrinic acid a,c-diamide adenosyltransferase [Anaerolineae bacterium]|nr:cob(I)yrinic acid a,c-diamide adenosyltransferase [Anaerolineae bacterium]
MKIYTRTGDDGTTQLMGPTRVPKDHPRVAAYGTVDELNAWLGYLGAMGIPSPWVERVQLIQRDLFVIGSYLALDPSVADRASSLPAPLEGRIAEMEAWIDECETIAGPARVFILPGGHLMSAVLHIIRTVCRRAERAVVALHQQEPVPLWILAYLNRLSDLLFMLARWVNAVHGIEEVPWNP